jgi:hypothetical protein
MARGHGSLFSRRELLAFNSEDFQTLQAKEILNHGKSSKCTDWEKSSFYEFSRTSGGIQRMDARYDQLLLGDLSVESLTADRDAPEMWLFSIEALLREIIKVNTLQGEQKEIDPPCRYLGYKIFDHYRTGFVFLPHIGCYKFISLAGIRYLCHDNGLVLLTLGSSLDEMQLESWLHHERMILAPLAQILNPNNFSLPLDTLLRPFFPVPAQHSLSELEITEKQWRDYQTHRYLCHDRIHISGDIPALKNNLITVNGKAKNLADTPFALLFRLALALWENRDGWIDAPTLHAEGVIRDPIMHQYFHTLRKELKEYLITDDPKLFIENNKSTCYRLSTHPDFVTCDREKLLNHPDDRIKTFARRCRADLAEMYLPHT